MSSECCQDKLGFGVVNSQNSRDSYDLWLDLQEEGRTDGRTAPQMLVVE